MLSRRLHRSLIRSGACALAGFLAVAVGVSAASGAAADIWPAQITPAADEAVLNQRVASLETAAATLPPNLVPAVRFEEAFVRAVARGSESDWLPAMRALAQAPGTDAVTAAVRDVAKAWIARVEMREIGAVLDSYYAQNVHYPTSLAAIERDLRSELKLDPWGEPWVYRTHAPAGFGKEVLQRYTIGPKRFPELGTLKEATLDRPPFVRPAWRIALKPVGESSALEFSNGSGVLALLQAGGTVGAYTLVYIGTHWALLASPDQLFTETF
jgi:hypothetical protein